MTTPLAIRIATNSAPLQTLDRILVEHGLPRQGDKVAAAVAVAGLIEAGKASLADLRRPAAKPTPAPTPAPTPMLVPPPDELAGLAAAADGARSRADEAIARVDGQREAMQSAITAMRATVQTATATAEARSAEALKRIDAVAETLTQRLAAADPDAAAAAAVRRLAAEQVTAAVADAFGRFRAVVESQGQQEAVAALAIEPEQREIWPGYTGAHWSHPEAPAVDADYLWPDPLIRAFTSAARRSRNVWLTGPKGAGKSTAAEQFAARSGRAFFRIQFNRYSTAEDFLGGMGLSEGTTGFKAGTLLVGLTTPGAVTLLDEISTADPGVLAMLHGLLEPCSTIHIGGQAWTRATGTMVIAADNTAGTGDGSGRYAGTREMNAALMDRFRSIVMVEAMTAEQMTAALVRRTGCSQRLAAHVSAAFSACRAEVNAGNVIDAPSLRRAVALVECLLDGIPPAEAWQQTVQLFQPAEGASGLYALFCSHIDSSLIAEEI